ncbi:protein-tyrosine-phosphatase [Saccharothrix saharensis]|uniref:Protein-tyrosine-phosphatase n=1 Tax=Saccharothrix saharensis TaxID=571190 RepID=A0A543J991_9PSEU|nr:helix-turn-helix domain-containing protein [Saccharothrix saharensis]TQM79378.1 protein-tyrosine-phosphatase [Saccharothrix saharensis]
MTADLPPDLVARAQLHHALGEPIRLAIAEHLLLGDASPSEIGARLDLPSNLLAHHVKILEQAGVVERLRSEGDRRRTYLKLSDAGTAAGLRAGTVRADRVVFVCARNSARSQLAARLWQRYNRVPATSAGAHPSRRIHPLAVAAARSRDLSLENASVHSLDEVIRPEDFVVVVCDNSHEELADALPERLHWSVRDPVRVGTEEAFDSAVRDLQDRVQRLARVVEPRKPT